jgi:hypothetical protein
MNSNEEKKQGADQNFENVKETKAYVEKLGVSVVSYHHDNENTEKAVAILFRHHFKLGYSCSYSPLPPLPPIIFYHYIYISTYTSIMHSN